MAVVSRPPVARHFYKDRFDRNLLESVWFIIHSSLVEEGFTKLLWSKGFSED